MRSESPPSPNSRDGYATGWLKSLRRAVVGAVGSSAMALGERWTRGKTPERIERMGERFGRVLFRFASRRRHVALSNLKLAFPEMGDRERLDLAKRVFEHFGRTTVDFLATFSRSREEILARSDFQGTDHLERMLEKGKGALLLSGHLGVWEAGAHYLSAKGFPLSVVARRTDNPAIERRVLRLRESTGIEVYARGDAAMGILSCLRRNRVVALLADQNAEDAYLPFFGKPAGTVLGPGILHRRSGAPMAFFYVVRSGPGAYRGRIFPPFGPAPGFDNPYEAMMASFNAELEGAVREYPEQWLWFHDRWKSARQRGLV